MYHTNLLGGRYQYYVQCPPPQPWQVSLPVTHQYVDRYPPAPGMAKHPGFLNSATFTYHHSQQGAIVQPNQFFLRPTRIYCQNGPGLRTCLQPPIPATRLPGSTCEQTHAGTQVTRPQYISISPSAFAPTIRDSVAGREPENTVANCRTRIPTLSSAGVKQQYPGIPPQYIVCRPVRLTTTNMITATAQEPALDSSIPLQPTCPFTQPGTPIEGEKYLTSSKRLTYPQSPVPVTGATHSGLQTESIRYSGSVDIPSQLKNNGNAQQGVQFSCHRSDVTGTVQSTPSQNADLDLRVDSDGDVPATTHVNPEEGAKDSICNSDTNCHSITMAANEERSTGNYATDAASTSRDEANITDDITTLPAYPDEPHATLLKDPANKAVRITMTEEARESRVATGTKRGLAGTEAEEAEVDSIVGDLADDDAATKTRSDPDRCSLTVMEVRHDNTCFQREGDEKERSHSGKLANNTNGPSISKRTGPGGRKVIITVNGTTYFMSKKRWKSTHKQR